MYQLDSVVLKDAAKEITGGKPKSPLKERRKHYDFLHIGCWDILSFSRSPLEHSSIWEKVILD
jgi:hypothetical protein